MDYDWRQMNECWQLLFDLLLLWAPDEPTRNRILVSNPEALYGFGR